MLACHCPRRLPSPLPQSTLQPPTIYRRIVRFVCCRIVSCIVAVVAVVVVVVVVSLSLAALLARPPLSSSLTIKWLVVAFPPQPSSKTRPEVRSDPPSAGIAPSSSSFSTPLPGRGQDNTLTAAAVHTMSVKIVPMPARDGIPDDVDNLLLPVPVVKPSVVLLRYSPVRSRCYHDLLLLCRRRQRIVPPRAPGNAMAIAPPPAQRPSSTLLPALLLPHC